MVSGRHSNETAKEKIEVHHDHGLSSREMSISVGMSRIQISTVINKRGK